MFLSKYSFDFFHEDLHPKSYTFKGEFDCKNVQFDGCIQI